ncbi:DUF6146 family protein [uncultured Psychroserpens sp.]|uniref:DUF6146 family protein n=1 Tax=uncultured Psychroserpens sp. TaxID=255436 RepID=UPI00262E4857|nr:DUF6146 family protein [uncultured Psychroserpens sp.]
MRRTIYLLLFTFALLSCGTSKTSYDSSESDTPEEDIVRIANDDIEYEIIIIEPGFNGWLQSIARPEGYYSQNFMEARNMIYVREWNRRVLQALEYDPNLYEMQIDYKPNIDYGYDVNYKLYNYFIYFQLTHKQQLGSWIPRI